MTTIAIRPNPRKAESMTCAFLLRDTAEACGSRALIYTAESDGLDRIFDSADVLVVLGGDGTILRAVREVFPRDIPILGVNFGHLGYLAQCRPEEAPEVIRSIVRGEFSTERRAVLTGEIIRTDGNRVPLMAVNEVCISRGTRRHMTRTRLEINGIHIDTFTGDGMLICTATGSTAYNQNAGGPIMMPEAENAVITPICARTFIGSSLVTCPDDEISVRIEGDSVPGMGNPLMLMDGRNPMELGPGDRVILRTSEHRVRMIRLKDYSFYKIIRQRLLDDDE